MACIPFRDASGRLAGFVCTGGRKDSPKCYVCGKSGSRRCDWRLTGPKAGQTCDRVICDRCTHHPNGNLEKDLCVAHAKMWKEDQRNPDTHHGAPGRASEETREP